MHSDTKTELISIHPLNQVIFDRHTRPSQFRTLHWLQVNSDPPHWNQVYSDHPHNDQVNFDANTKAMSFSGRVTLRVIHTITYSCDTAAMRIIYLRVPIRIILDVSVLTTVKPRKYCGSIYIPHFATWYTTTYVWYWWPDFVTFHSSFT